MAEMLDESRQLESSTVGVFRTAATIKGGRRFSFSSLVVVGDRQGQVGLGYGKANEVPPAIEKAQKEGRKRLRRIPLQGGTIPHEVIGRFGSSRVKLMPASPGTGVVAGASVRAVLEMVGVTDCLTKVYGSTNKQNVVKAAMNGLEQFQEKERIAELRGVEIGKTEVEEKIERGQAYLPGGGSDMGPKKEGGEQGVGSAGEPPTSAPAKPAEEPGADAGAGANPERAPKAEPSPEGGPPAPPIEQKPES